MFSIHQHLNSNQEELFAFIYLFIYLFCIKRQERMIKIQLAHICRSYLKFWHILELSHKVHWGINLPPQKLPPPSFAKPLQIVQAPFLGNSSYILLFL